MPDLAGERGPPVVGAAVPELEVCRAGEGDADVDPDVLLCFLVGPRDRVHGLGSRSRADQPEAPSRARKLKARLGLPHVCGEFEISRVPKRQPVPNRARLLARELRTVRAGRRERRPGERSHECERGDDKRPRPPRSPSTGGQRRDRSTPTNRHRTRMRPTRGRGQQGKTTLPIRGNYDKRPAALVLLPRLGIYTRLTGRALPGSACWCTLSASLAWPVG